MIIPILPKHPVDYLLYNNERRVIHEESEAREYLETFYHALIDNRRRCPMLDFIDLITAFRSSGELLLLPTLECANSEDLGREVRQLLLEESIAKHDIVLLTICTSTQCCLEKELSDLGFKKSVINITREDAKFYIASFSSEKIKLSSLMYMGTMIIHRKSRP